MKILVIGALLFSCSVCAAKGTEGDRMAGLLLTGIYAGACAVMGQLATFHAKTMIEGGTVFLARFIKTEAARLDMSPVEYREHCFLVQSKYKAFMAEARRIKESIKRPPLKRRIVFNLPHFVHSQQGHCISGFQVLFAPTIKLGFNSDDWIPGYPPGGFLEFAF